LQCFSSKKFSQTFTGCLFFQGKREEKKLYRTTKLKSLKDNKVKVHRLFKVNVRCVLLSSIVKETLENSSTKKFAQIICHTYTCTHAHTYNHTHIHMYTCTHTRKCKHAHTRSYAHTHTYTHTHTHYTLAPSNQISKRVLLYYLHASKTLTHCIPGVGNSFWFAGHIGDKFIIRGPLSVP